MSIMKTIRFPGDTEAREIYDEKARNLIGDLSRLNTTNKDSIVDAVNEAMTTGNADMTGYATEQYVQEYAQPKGEYLTEHQDISGKLNISELPEAINTALTQAKESGEFDGKDYILTDADKTEIAETVKAEVPLVKMAEQPTFVNSAEEMTDTSKVYLMSDGYLYAYMKTEGGTSYTFTADDFIEGALTATGDIYKDGTNRIFTADLIDLSVGTVSIICPEPYQYITYYYTDNDANTHIGKTAFKSGNVDDVLNDTTASGTVEGAKYCRISLRDKTDMNADISGRTDEFMANIIISQARDEMTEVYEWKSMGLSYNQPADYENRIAALERAMEGIENGTY